MAANQSFHLVTAVWGSEYTDTYLNISLPSLLAPGNIPSLPAAHCTYKIFSPEADAERIRQSEAFKALAALVTVEFRPLNRIQENPYITSSNCYRTATIEAGQSRATILYLIPDMILADGSLRAVKRFLDEGKRAVMVAGMRAVKETLVPEALARFRTGHAVSAPPRQLVELAMRHLHPIMQHHFYENEGSRGFNPSFFCWEVPGEGYVVHCAHLHPVAVDLRGQRATLHGTIDDDLLFDLGLSADELAYADDSDDVLWFEISAGDRRIPPPIGKRLWEILRWLNGATYPHQRAYLSHALQIHCRGTDSAAWRATEARAAKTIATMLAAYELEKERIRESPADYAAPPAVRIGDEELAGDPAAAIRKIMDVAGAAVVVDAVAEALEVRARSYLARGTSRRIDRSFIKLGIAMTIVGAGKAFRALLKRLKRG